MTEAYGAIVLGRFRLVAQPDGTIWIGERDGGEGGAFSAADVEQMIEKFYAERF